MAEKKNDSKNNNQQVEKGYQPNVNGGYQPPKKVDNPSPPPKKP
ncbi:TPA: hypothetical protein MDQ80_002200 [Klebsiella pneumoniae]|nr:hypothetical protein pJN226_0129 [Klebsiella phage pJN2-26]